MAGSGKTTFLQRTNAYLHTLHQASPKTNAAPYVLNLDPAVRSVPYESNIDIRDSVNYKEVMKRYNLGPNGAILTSLNLFATKVDQVLGILENRCLPPKVFTKAQSQTSSSSTVPAASPKPATNRRPDGQDTTLRPQHILLDTPGQIEVFVWSASGSILLSSLASAFPTVIAYIIDTPRTLANTATFMSNMLYALSILYKTKLPCVLVFNKTDVKGEEEAVEWMRDFESFQAALRAEEEGAGAGSGSGYMGSLLNSMSLVLEEFYNTLSVVGVSSMTGDGMEAFFEAVEEKRVEFEKDYRPEMERRLKDAEAQKAQIREQEVERMMGDMGVSSNPKGPRNSARSGAGAAVGDADTVSDAEDIDEDDDDGGMVDPDGEDEDENGEEYDEEGLKERYQRAISGGAGRGSSGIGAAANYIRGSQR